jgi:hypothetical protein
VDFCAQTDVAASALNREMRNRFVFILKSPLGP